jgi:hypothetical protein
MSDPNTPETLRQKILAAEPSVPSPKGLETWASIEWTNIGRRRQDERRRMLGFKRKAWALLLTEGGRIRAAC